MGLGEDLARYAGTSTGSLAVSRLWGWVNAVVNCAAIAFTNGGYWP